MSSQTVIVGMSGGVDSSVAAKLLLDAGYAVQGLFMKNWEEDDGTEYCTAIEDLADAQAVCDKLGIELHTANFSAEYWDNVFAHFLEEYKAGRTPNPDILCNREIKFNVFREYAEVLGADRIATGHYVRMGQDSKPQLLKGLDHNKDQSYFLQAVSEQQLEGCLFPVGDLEKTEVRAIAEAAGLPTHSKKDSTGICFIGERRFQDFLAQYIPAQPGKIIDTEGREIGTHNGVMFYTLGQRQGLGIGGVKDLPEEPWYVVGKDVAANTLTVAQGNQHPALFSQALYCDEITWIDGVGPKLPATLSAKTRYRQPDQACQIMREGEQYRVTFVEPQRAVTPGQWLCLYDGDVCLGGGIIEATEPDKQSRNGSSH
jgi:tRNA-specific 2-thiouridylase